MKKYKVLVIEILGINNIRYAGGSIVEASFFPVGNCEQLVEQGFLEEIKEAEEVEQPKVKGKK